MPKLWECECGGWIDEQYTSHLHEHPNAVADSSRPPVIVPRRPNAKVREIEVGLRPMTPRGYA